MNQETAEDALIEELDSFIGGPSIDRIKSGRYGIAEWYGKDVMTMSSVERKYAADVATERIGDKQTCPFMATLSPDAKCNKKGGVCTIRKYERDRAGVIVPVHGGSVATTCPARFLGTDTTNRPVLGWVAEKMLDSKASIIVKETPFLRKLLSQAATQRASSAAQLDLEILEAAAKSQDPEALPEEAKKAGRIDWLLMDPKTEKDNDPKWCALETQAVYFSGDKMGPEFAAYSEKPDDILFPVGFRRPDYRSSGPKRLAPQLSVKVPVLRGWGKKVAVLVDKYFFDSMYDLPEAYTQGRTDQEKRDNCEVAWFIVDYDANMSLILLDYRFSTLAGSVEALNATAPMSKDAFNSSLRALAADKRKLGKKVFRP